MSIESYRFPYDKEDYEPVLRLMVEGRNRIGENFYKLYFMEFNFGAFKEMLNVGFLLKENKDFFRFFSKQNILSTLSQNLYMVSIVF